MIFTNIFRLFLIPILLVLSCDNIQDKPEKTSIPDIAKGRAVSKEKGYYVEEIRDGLYWVTNGVYNTMFLTTGEGVIVIDAPPSIGDKYLSAIKEVTEESVTHVIYSHSHADHISSASIFPENAVYIAHQEIWKTLSRRANSERNTPFGKYSGGSTVPLPTLTFTENYTLNVGNQTLELSYKGINHEAGNIFIYAPQQKVLMLVDVADPGWIPFKSLAGADYTLGYIDAYNEILSYDFDTFVGGHLNRPGDRADVKLHGEYMSDLETSGVTAIESVTFSSIAKEVGTDDPFLLFDKYLDAVATKCEDIMLPKWKDRLGGVDVFTFDNCSQMISSLRLE